MIKNEQSKSTDQTIRIAPVLSAPPPQIMFQSIPVVLPSRSIDPNAIDITSLKGQFAWEKILHNDTYLPVIFRGDTKYFCVRMLRKLLPEYPEDIIRRSSHYQYRKSIDLYHVTSSEVELLNRINGQHSRWAYSRQPFTALDEIVRVSDFLPFYEHLLHGSKPNSVISNMTAHTLRQLLPQPQQTVQRTSDFMNTMPAILRTQSTIPQGTPVQIQSYPLSSEICRANMSSTVRPTAPVPSLPRPPRLSKTPAHPFTVVIPTRPAQPQPSMTVLLNNTTNSTATVPSDTPPIVPNIIPLPTASSMGSSSSPIVSLSVDTSSPSSSSPIIPSSTAIVSRKSSTSSSSSISTSNPSHPHCGWLQVNKLYTPFVSVSATNHHLYKIPINLLTFYDLIKNTSTETTDSKDFLLPSEQTLVTSQEIEMINELCVKQNIKPLASDTKLIQLSAFYQYCSANILFLKELPLTDPKASICKEWSSIVQINGGICRLRNITTLHEQTVPFIGNNLLKNFLLSSHCLSTASLAKPSESELEFLQLILFFSNISINLRNAQLIDIESVRKEYNVDLILLFNDKFPVNVLNYQQQGNRSNVSQGQITPTNSTAPTNTIAESTPPPSPPSPPINQPQSNSTSQLPLTSSTNRYHKTVQFHGHPMTAYICSGLGSNAQRECVSIKSLCNILHPNSTTIDKLEMKMLRLLRSKNINRFRPQNQQSMGFTRLIDIKDAEKFWDFIEQGMHSITNDNEEVAKQPNLTSTPKASTVERVETVDQTFLLETSIEVNKGEKRPLDEPLDEEDIPVLERINKRVRFSEKENTEQSTNHDKTNLTDDITSKKRTKNSSSTKKRLLPSTRSNKQSTAIWVRKYNIEDCCIRLDHYNPIYGKE